MILNAIYSRLNGSADLTNVVGEKLYAINVPEEDVAPAIAYNAMTLPSQTKGGYSDSEDKVEIMCLTKDYDTGASMANTIAKLFYSFGYNYNGVVVMHSKVDSITRSYNDLYKEWLFIINITFKSKIT